MKNHSIENVGINLPTFFIKYFLASFIFFCILIDPSLAQGPQRICYTTNGQNCIVVSPTNPFPTTATLSGSVTVTFPTIGSAVPTTGIYNALNVGGTLRGMTGLGLGSTFSQTVAIVDASGNQITSFGSSAAVGATGAAVPASANYVGINSGGNLTGWNGAVTQSGTWNIGTITTITGPVPVTQSGTWTVQPGNTANTTPWLATINQGGNSAVVKAASTAPVAADAALAVSLSPNSAGLINTTNITPTNCSGTITTGGTAQNAFTAGATKSGFTIMNLSTEVMWISFTTTAAADTAGSYVLNPSSATTAGGSYSTPFTFGMNTALSVIGATTGNKFTCTWW